MPEDASLDDFLQGDDHDDADGREGEDGSRDAGGSDGEDRVGDRERGAVGDDPVPAEPARSVSVVATDGRACTDCGTEVDRLWTGEGGPTCSDCRSW